MLKRLRNTQPEIALLLLALIPLCIVRMLPSLTQELGTLGYDYGFYRYAALHPALQWDHLLTGIHGGYSHILFLLFRSLHLPPDVELTASLYIAAITLGLAVFYFLKPYSRAAALWGCLLLACSIVQSEAYNMFLWKTILALPLLIAGLWATQKRTYLLLSGVLLTLLLTHRTSLFLLLLTLAACAAIRLLQKRRWLVLSASVACIVFIIGYFHSSVSQLWRTLFNPSNSSVAEGIFLNGQNMVLLLPTILFAIYGGIVLIKKKQLPVVMVFTCICGAWILLRLPFFHRFYIYLDLGLLVLSSIGLEALWRHRKQVALKTLLVGAVTLLFFLNVQHIKNSDPLISEADIHEIAAFSPPPPVPFVLATSADDAPWLLGFLHGTRLAAPGLFEDSHTKTAWQQFWYGDIRQVFLSDFPQPLYIYDRSFRLSGAITSCLERISVHFSKFICK